MRRTQPVLTKEQADLVGEHVKLVTYTINKVFKRQLSPALFELAYDAGLDGLFTAARKADPEKTFSTFACCVISKRLFQWWSRRGKKLASMKTTCFSAYGSSPFYEDDRNTSMEKKIPNRRENTFPSLAAEAIKELLPSLPQTHQTVIEHCYGLNDKPKLRRKDIALLLNVDENKVEYYRKLALQRMANVGKKTGVLEKF